MNDILDEELNSAFVSPDKAFKEQKLSPYTEGSRLLLMQIRSDDDSAMFFVWAFIFVHIELAKNRKDAIRLCWNKDSFREKLVDWMSGFSDQDRESATALVGEVLEEARKGQVEIIPSASSSRGNF